MAKRSSWFVPLGFWTAILVSAGTAMDDAEKSLPQELLPVAVQVVDPEGQPVADAKIVPWALRSSQGHGLWRSADQGDDDRGGKGPVEVTTDAEGRAAVVYPTYRDLDERVRTTEVTISVNHPDFVYISHENINVPQPAAEPHTVKLARGARLEVEPIQDGKPAPLAGLHALWSDSRSWQPGESITATAAGALKLPTMAAGEGEVLLVRVDGERATHFSSVVPVELVMGETLHESIELRPSVRIEGKLSANVPRPVKNGRVKVGSLPRTQENDSVDWVSWAPVTEDGTFVIDAWPDSVPVQVIALCDGFIAESGQAPAVVKDVRDPDPYRRPQVFTPREFKMPIEIAMNPMTRCDIEVVDGQDTALPGVKVWSWPNVGWWNGGSQVYCTPLVRGERLLQIRDYFAAADKLLDRPFNAVTDEHGRCQLWLPGKRADLTTESAGFELPVNRGRRDQRIELIPGEVNHVRLVLQPKGTEYLGEWDKLAGVLFGCTGDECRRLLEDQGFRKKMVKVGELFDSAADPHDPAMLQQAYAEIAQGFDELKDQQEADNWRKKSAAQAAQLAKPSANIEAAE